MARGRQDSQSLAALVMLGILPAGCSAVEAGGEKMTATDRNAAFFTLLDVAASPDPGKALADRGARVDRQYERSGQWRFTIPGLAGEGSELIFTPGEPHRVDALTLVPPPELRVTGQDVSRRFGEGRRLPALPDQGWRLDYRKDGQRIIATYSSAPDQPTSTLVRITRRMD